MQSLSTGPNQMPIYVIKPITNGYIVSKQTQLYMDDLMHQSKNGEGFKVGIIDSGICKNLKSQSNIIFINPNLYINKYTDEYDDHGHGTHIYGIIHQLIPSSKYYIAKALDDSGRISVNNVIVALKWMIENNVHAINISMLFRELPPNMYKKLTDLFKECYET